MSTLKPRIVFLASQSGTLFEKIVQACNSQRIKATPVALIASRPGAGCIERAHQLGVSVEVLDVQSFSSSAGCDGAMLKILNRLNPDWLVLAGFMSKIGPQVLKAFPNKIINIHPSLLPKFGGKGMYGIHVHRAVIEAGEKKTGITVHLLSENYDEGPVLDQKELAVVNGESAEELQDRLKFIEGDFYVSVLAKHLAQKGE